MFGSASGMRDIHGSPLGLAVSVGLSWTPQLARPRRIIPRVLLPGGRRPGGAHRRPKQGGQAAVALDQGAVSQS